MKTISKYLVNYMLELLETLKNRSREYATECKYLNLIELGDKKGELVSIYIRPPTK